MAIHIGSELFEGLLDIGILFVRLNNLVAQV
jgi:hypothetical protein